VRELSLFTGAGGGLLGTHHLLGWETVGYVEIEDYCQRVIKQRIADGLLPEAPIFSDIRAFISEGYAASYTGMVDVITAGFPCQPFSVAGKQAGENDPRNMWPQTIEAISIIRPKYVFLENVPGLLNARSITCVCGWPNRWRGMYFDTEDIGEKESLLLSGDYNRDVVEGGSIITSNKKEFWRNFVQGQGEIQELGWVSEMAYWWGKSDGVPCESSTLHNTKGISNIHSDRVGDDETECSDIAEWDEGLEQDKRQCGTIKAENTPIKPEGTRCPRCGRSLDYTTNKSFWYFGFILWSLAQARYDARWITLGADDVGAPHRRKRLWIMAESNMHGYSRPKRDEAEQGSDKQKDGVFV